MAISFLQRGIFQDELEKTVGLFLVYAKQRITGSLKKKKTNRWLWIYVRAFTVRFRVLLPYRSEFQHIQEVVHCLWPITVITTTNEYTPNVHELSWLMGIHCTTWDCARVELIHSGFCWIIITEAFHRKMLRKRELYLRNSWISMLS